MSDALSKGLGGDGDNFSDVVYEGYGPGGVAVFVETSTDNVTRTVANMRFYFSRNGGTLGQSGSLQFLFDHKSVFEVLQSQLTEQGLDEDDFMLEMIDAGAEEVDPEEESLHHYRCQRRLWFYTSQIGGFEYNSRRSES